MSFGQHYRLLLKRGKYDVNTLVKKKKNRNQKKSEEKKKDVKNKS